MSRKHKNLVILATVLSAACIFSACGKDKEDQVVVAEAPTPTPTVAPTITPVPSVAATAQKVTYTSKDSSVSIVLPDNTWKNTSDNGKSIIFNSDTQGNISITYANTDADLAKVQIPSSKDLAGSITAGTSLTEGTDFDILDYTATEMDGVDVYRYTVKAADASKMNGYAYIENYYLTDGSELYQISGSLKLQDPTSLNTMKEAVTSFRILKADSPLKAAADTIASQNSSSATPSVTPSVTPAASGDSDNSDSSDDSDTNTSSTSDGSSSDSSYDDSSSSGDDSGSGNSGQSSEDGWYDGDTFISYDDGYFDDDGYWHWYGDDSGDDGSGDDGSDAGSSDDGSGDDGSGSDDGGWYDNNGNYFSYNDGYFDDDGVWQWY